MKLFVTGANGFLGRYVVAEAVKRGYKVRALVRPAAKNIPEIWKEHSQIEIVRGDLRAKKSLNGLINKTDCIIHLAASKTGDLYEQFGGTVLATENLLQAMSHCDINKLVLTSSFSVYEYMKKRGWSVLNESTPTAHNPFTRDEYCQTKIIQEKLALEYAHSHNWKCIVLRPGVIFGKDNLWTARIGMQAGERLWICTGMFAPLPLTYVENCASAILEAVGYDGPEQTMVLNVVDTKTPIQRSYVKELKLYQNPKPKILIIPWIIMRMIARTAWLVNRLFFKDTAKIPGLFVPSRLHARCKPLRYSNKKIISVLGWKPEFSWKEAVRRSIEMDNSANLSGTRGGK